MSFWVDSVRRSPPATSPAFVKLHVDSLHIGTEGKNSHQHCKETCEQQAPAAATEEVEDKVCDAFETQPQRGRWLSANALYHPHPTKTPLYAVQYIDHARALVYTAANPSLVLIATTTSFYLAYFAARSHRRQVGFEQRMETQRPRPRTAAAYYAILVRSGHAGKCGQSGQI